MGNLDLQRYALYIALALLSFMLLIEWQQFSTTYTPRPSSMSPISPTTFDAVPDAESLPETPADEGIPEALDLTFTQQDEEPKAETLLTKSGVDPSRLVRVETDTVAVQIDLEGGDLVEIALLTFYTELDRPDLPFLLLEDNATRNYVAQSGLIGPDGIDRPQARARYQSTSKQYQMKEGSEELLVELLHDAGAGVSIIKRYRFHRGSHLIGVEHEIRNLGEAVWRAGLFGQIRRDDSKGPGGNESMFSVQPFLGFATTTSEVPYKKFSFDDVTEAKWSERVDGGWVAMVQHYFISAWIPDPALQHSYSLLKSGSGFFIARFTSPPIEVAPGETQTIRSGFYAGPKDQYRLQDMAPGLDLTVDYGWLWWIAQPLFAFLYFFATGELNVFGWSFQLGSGIGNWGWSIVMLTVLIKACFYYLSATSYRSMARMRKLQPQMLELRERYGDDRQKMSQATMELYKKEKVNPLGGCLPILIQMPVFIALYWTLLESVELRHAPFMLWIRDMSVMDPYFVLPLLMGASMFFQQKLNPPPPDPMQAKIFQIMPIMFTVFFLWFPSGLVLYWLVNNLLSILQQWIITRNIDRAG